MPEGSPFDAQGVGRARRHPGPPPQALEPGAVIFEDGRRAPFDAIVWATGYRREGLPLAPTRSVQDLYRLLFLPTDPRVAWFGQYPAASLASWPTLELSARWFAGVQAGRIALAPEAERLAAQREDQARYDGRRPVDSVLENLWLAEQLGALPNPQTDWPAFWELMNTPPVPSLYRLVGPHAWSGAREAVTAARRRLYVNLHDPTLADVERGLRGRLGLTAEARA
ncbi:MAG: hypothetical protein IPN01_35815 [Deltaproteobacteria bacterium]|nr:hypothetical protein [Deltaproteobacteria bacterium]